MILYLHGFNSGPASDKASLLQAYALASGRRDVECPQLPVQPLQAMQLILALASRVDASELCLVGSSLGGYYALYAAERLGCRAVLVNPAIRPYALLQDYVGWQEHPYTGERYEIRHDHLHDLLELDVQVLHEKHHYWLLTQTGDEVLDYRLGVEKLAGAHQCVISGGSHAFTGFADWLPSIFAFADGAVPQPPLRQP